MTHFLVGSLLYTHAHTRSASDSLIGGLAAIHTHAHTGQLVTHFLVGSLL